MPNDEYENVDDFLEHFGVKGMRWGHRKAESSIRQRNRELNKASRDRDKAKDQFEVEEARRRHYGGENAKRLTDARAKYKKDKIELGSREARKLLNRVKDEAYIDLFKSHQYLNGKEVAKHLLAGRIVREIGLRRKYGEKK